MNPIAEDQWAVPFDIIDLIDEFWPEVKKHKVNTSIRDRYEGLREHTDIPFLVPGEGFIASAAYLYMGLLTKIEQIDEIVLLPRGGFVLDQAISTLKYDPLLYEVHTNRHAGDDIKKGVEQLAIDDLQKIKGRSVLIADDDYATGATLDLAYKALQEYSPSRISLFTLRGGPERYVHGGDSSQYELFTRDTDIMALGGHYSRFQFGSSRGFPPTYRPDRMLHYYRNELRSMIEELV